MTKKELMAELKDVRYYYSRKDALSEAKKNMAENEIVAKAKKYGEIMKSAPIRLYDLFFELYMNNNTQESLAEKWGYSPQNIKWLNGKLYKYILDQLKTIDD